VEETVLATPLCLCPKSSEVSVLQGKTLKSDVSVGPPVAVVVIKERVRTIHLS
jgi:hypothetical protein